MTTETGKDSSFQAKTSDDADYFADYREKPTLGSWYGTIGTFIPQSPLQHMTNESPKLQFTPCSQKKALPLLIGNTYCGFVLDVASTIGILESIQCLFSIWICWTHTSYMAHWRKFSRLSDNIVPIGPAWTNWNRHWYVAGLHTQGTWIIDFGKRTHQS